MIRFPAATCRAYDQDAHRVARQSWYESLIEEKSAVRGMNDVQIIGAVRRIIRHAARESAFRSFSAGVSLERLDVRCVAEGDGFAIHATYRLRATKADDTRPVLLDGTRSPFAVEAVRRADGSAGVRQALPPRRLFLLEPAPGTAWEDTVVETKLRWNRSAVPCAVLPDDLPQLRTGAAGGPQPSIRVEASPGVRVGGIAGDPSGEWSVENLLQAVLAPADMVRESGDLLAVGRFATGLDVVDHERMARLLERIVAFHGRLFGVTFPLRLVVAPDATRSAGGAHLAIRQLETLGLRGAREPDDVVLGSRLASMWWGAGCRIEGPRARELEAALRAAAGMLWADFVNGERGTMLADLDRLAGRSRSQDWWAGAQGGFRRGLHARWSLALYDALRSAPAAASALRVVSSADRGTFVPEGRVLAAFADAGVRLVG